MEENALALVIQRNEFYKKKFYMMLGIYLLSLVVIVILIITLVFIVKNPTRPLYFVADQVGRFIPNIPNDVPNMSLEDVRAWTIEAVESANSFDYVNYRAQLQDAQKYFSNYGWTTYMKGLSRSNNLLALTQRKWVFIAKVTDTPKLITQGIIGGFYAWRFEMPLLVTYLRPPAYDVKTSIANANVVTVIVVRANLLQSYRGLSMISMILNSATNAPTVQTMNLPS